MHLAVLLFAQQIPFKNYTVREGLPSNSVSDILQDHKGYIWLATDFGLAKFDGYHFENLSLKDGLTDNLITCLSIDKNGTIWAGTESGGISIIDNFTITSINSDNGLFTEPVNDIFVDSNNNTWACARTNAISKISSETIRTFSNNNSEFSGNVNCHLIDSKGTVWFGGYNGLYYFDSTFHHYSHPLINDLIVWDILEDSNGIIWLASQEHGVFSIEGNNITNYNIENGLSTNTTLSIIEDKKGRILIGTYYGGINIIQNKKINTSLIAATKDYFIWELFADSKNRIWARTHEQGVLLLRNNKISNYSTSNNLVSNVITQIFEDNFNNIWFSSPLGISNYGKVFFENYVEGFALDDNQVSSLYVNNSLQVFAGTYKGLTIFNPNTTPTYFTNKNGLPEDATVGNILEISDDEIWLATIGLTQLKNNKLKHYTIPELEFEGSQIIPRDLCYKNHKIYGATEIGLLVFDTQTKDYSFLNVKNGLINNDIYSIDIDTFGNIWCGTSNGLSIFDGKDFYNYTTFHGLPNNFCNDIAFTRNGVAWIATDYGVCSATLSEKFILSTRNYSVDDGLKSNSIVSVLCDNNDNIWLGHNEGVDYLNPKTKQIKSYGEKEGFLPIENNLGAIAKDKLGNIWFGTPNGIVRYLPNSDIQNKQAPQVYIKAINLYNDTSSIDAYYTEIDSTTLLPKNLKLNYSKKNIYFDYVGLHYTIVEKNTYKYRLLGYDNNWSAVTTDIQSIPYQKLPPGKYTFQVKAANCDGVWTKEASEYSFQILPPFWKTWWFISIEVISAILILYLIIYLRERKLRYDKKVLTIKVQERTEEIEKQKDQIEVQRDEIVRQKQEITDSIKYAEHIQSAILPKDNTISPLLKDYFILFKPRDIVSGDFYWIHGNKDKVIALAADCTGHGVPGAFMSMLGVSILNQIATKDENRSAGEILDNLRDHIISTLSHSGKGHEARDGMDLAMCIIDYKTYTVEYAGAYNPLILIRNNEAEVYKASKMPVGLHMGEQVPFVTNKITIEKNDCLYMFSDGYADQFGGPEGKKFKSGVFRKLLVEINEKPLSEQQKILDTTIEDWMKGYEQVDDILVMGIRIV